MLINETCKDCLLNKNIDKYPADASEEEIRTYRREVQSIIEHSDGQSTPQVAEKMSDLRRDLFGLGNNYGEIKKFFNTLMLSLQPHMEEQIRSAEDPLKMAVQYAMVGNYIDFGAMENVDENVLRDKLDEARSIEIEEEMMESFRSEAMKARRLVYLTDNCGEVVTDKILIKVMRELNPELSVTVIVRGKPASNDATLEDAGQVRMEEAAQRVIGNGAGMPGNVISAISAEAREEIECADMLISKGQGNYEGLSGCGLNVFYLFLCKCDLFRRRFNVPRFTGILTREADVVK